MSYDDIIEVLAAALLEKADTLGCLEVLDGFSQRPDTEIEVSAPISEEMLALPLHKQEWPEECAPILKESGAATLGELVEYLNHCTAIHSYEVLRRSGGYDENSGGGFKNSRRFRS